ncbi:MAG: DUF2065 family protein [Planktomarina sp.]|nr:DUF2065 family protein [Planktomarina sp.]
MIDKILLGLGAVLILEGLVYLLAPHSVEVLLKYLKLLSISDRRKFGALVVVFGFILILIIS